MTIKLTPASFLSGVRQSGLIESPRLDALIAEMERAGIDQNSATALAGALVKSGAITEWQSDKLLQGRHKGFILGRYKLLSLLGAGEMSAVYLAEHVMLERRCAIKVLPGNKVKDTSYLGRFHREAKAVARLLTKTRAMIKAGRYEEAMVMLEVVAYSDLRTKFVNLLKAECLRATGKPDEAEKLAQENARMWPDNPLVRRIFRFVAYVFVEAKRMVYSKW